MKLFKLKNLPYLLASLPVLSVILSNLSALEPFNGLIDITDEISTALFILPLYLYDSLGWIPFEMGKTPELLGNPVLATLLYMLTASIALFILGKIIWFLMRPKTT